MALINRICEPLLALLIALVSSPSANAQSYYNVATWAGTGMRGFNDGTSGTAEFSEPRSVAVDINGNVYVADRGNQKIRKITAGGVVSTLAGSNFTGSQDGEGTAASFTEPSGVAVDASGNVYVADSHNHKIRKISPAGVVSSLAGSGIQGSADGTGAAASFRFPNGIAVDAGGNVYVADLESQKIRKISPTGVVSTLAGSGSRGSTDGTAAAASFDYPRAVAVDLGGSVYVADTNNQKIRKISPAGVVSTLAGSGSSGLADGTGAVARFNYPIGVAVDVGGNVFVADTHNHRIRKITPAGVVSTLAGTGVTGGNANGNGTVARFNFPYGVTVDAGGKIFVADGGNHTVRICTPPLQQTISFPVIEAQTYAAAPFLLNASVSSGLPLSFSIVSGPASISGNFITLTGTGTVVVRAS